MDVSQPIGYFDHLSGVFDLTKVGYILELLRGYGKLRSCVDTCLQVTTPILRKAFDVLPSLSLSHFQSLLFKSEFFGLFCFSSHRRSNLSQTDKVSQTACS